MSAQNKKGTGTKAAVLQAVMSGCCNTSFDVSDEIGVSVSQCSSYVHSLARQGVIRFNGRTMPSSRPDGRGRRLHVFEVVNA